VKSILVIYNIIFLLVGNVLFSNNHYLNEHEHEHEHGHEGHECQKCISIENNSNYISGFQKVDLSNNKINKIELNFLSTIEYSIEKIYFTRAPPKS